MATGSLDTGTTKERMLYIDNLRLILMMLVITIHLAVTVSGLGSWYYVYGTHLDTMSKVWFAFYQSFTQGYFMGLLFLIAGYFVAGSYDRKGFGQFVGDRFKRLMIPTLIFMIAITPFIVFIELGYTATSSVVAGSGGVSVIGFLSGTGPMWFAAALFGFSLIYGFYRLTAPKAVSGRRKLLEPSIATAIMLALAIAVLAFLIRIVQPIGTSILNFQLCYFASYAVLFIVGILAYRSNLFSQISYRAGKRCVVGAMVLGFFVWLIVVIAGKGNTALFMGGLTWQSAAFSLWESFVAVAMSIGLIAVFREKFNHQSRLVKTLSDNSFAVYMFHPMIIIPITLLLAPLALYPIAKWLLLCIICIPLCFAATFFVFRRIPYLKKVL